MKKVILTKKRIKALDTAISFDDILYERFKRMDDNFRRRVMDFEKRKYVTMVVRHMGDKFGTMENMQIVKEIKTDDGIILEIR